jgi:hypothetical protein
MKLSSDVALVKQENWKLMCRKQEDFELIKKKFMCGWRKVMYENNVS